MQSKFQKIIVAFYRLSRIKTIVVDYFILLSIISIISTQGRVSLLHLFVATLISLSIHCYAFIVNDVEDAEDDAMDPKKKLRNPVSSGYITPRQGLMILQTTSIPAAIAAFIFAGLDGLFVTVLALILGHLYSWKKVRLKSYPILDVLSHSFALAGFQPLLYNTFEGGKIDLVVLFIFLGVSVISIGGAIYNQYRDYEVDVKSNLKNTTIFFGKKLTPLIILGLYSFGITICSIALLMILAD